VFLLRSPHSDIVLSMSDADDKLTPADPRDLAISIAAALTSDSRLAKTQAAEAMANVVAERIVERLERDGFIVSGGRRWADTRRSGAALRAKDQGQRTPARVPQSGPSFRVAPSSRRSPFSRYSRAASAFVKIGFVRLTLEFSKEMRQKWREWLSSGLREAFQLGPSKASVPRRLARSLQRTSRPARPVRELKIRARGK
jgi:hypothetical protein